MPSEDRTSFLKLDRYQNSRDDIRRLKARLPEDAVVSLADEVLRRLAKRVPSTTISPPEEEIKTFCRALMSKDDDAAAQFILNLQIEGASPEDIYLHYLADAARLLGKWWEESIVSFLEVTIGTSRIYPIMRGMAHLFEPAIHETDKTAVFASVPDETHVLGIRMATDLFRKNGWTIDLKLGLDHDTLVDEIEAANPPIIGLSSGGIHSCTALARLVIALRISNPTAPILLSGQILEEAPEEVKLMGVDATVNDVPKAQAHMERFWDQMLEQQRRA